MSDHVAYTNRGGIASWAPPHPSRVKLDKDPTEDAYLLMIAAANRKPKAPPLGQFSDYEAKVLKIMSDGRYRCAHDIASTITGKQSVRDNMESVKAARTLKNLVVRERLKSENVTGTTVYRVVP